MPPSRVAPNNLGADFRAASLITDSGAEALPQPVKTTVDSRNIAKSFFIISLEANALLARYK